MLLHPFRARSYSFVALRGFLFFLLNLLQNLAEGRLPGVATKGTKTQVATLAVHPWKAVNLAKGKGLC